MKQVKNMIRRAEIKDADVLTTLAIQMWPEHDPGRLAEEFRKLIKNENTACFLKYAGSKPIAFEQCQL